MNRSYVLMAAAAAMAIAPVGASAAPQRAPAPLSDEAEGLRASPIFIIVAVAALLGLAIVLLTDGDDNPTSP